LLPKSDYKIIDDSSKLKKVFLLHYVDPGVSCKTNSDIKKNILDILIPQRFYNGLSCSLFSKIQIGDMKIKVDGSNNQYEADWKPGVSALRPHNNEVKYIRGRRVISLKMDEVLDFNAKSSIGQDKDREDVTIKLVPLHSPIRINYWHYNIFMEVIKDSDKSKVTCSEKRTKRLAKSISDDFVKIVHRSCKHQCRYIEKGIYKEKRRRNTGTVPVLRNDG